jgi:voltage-gated potassium channel
MLRYNKAIDNLKKAFIDVKNELIIFSVACVFLLYFSAVGIYFFENEAQPENFKSIFHSIWWSVATLTTVGYGDVYPITLGGKIFSSIVIFLGLGLIAVPTGLIASSFGKAFNKDQN